VISEGFVQLTGNSNKEMFFNWTFLLKGSDVPYKQRFLKT